MEELLELLSTQFLEMVPIRKMKWKVFILFLAYVTYIYLENFSFPIVCAGEREREREREKERCVCVCVCGVCVCVCVIVYVHLQRVV